MRAIHTLILLGALLAIAGAANAQNAPCPECDADGDGNVDNSYHSVDVGAIVENETQVTEEVLADTDVAHSHDNDEKGFWLWFQLCLSAFVQHVEDALGVHTDVDANAEVYADSNGADIDASVTGLTAVCAEVEANMTCDWDFDESELGDLDGATWETMSTVEATTGTEVFVPAILPDTGDSDTDVCVHETLELTC